MLTRKSYYYDRTNGGLNKWVVIEWHFLGILIFRNRMELGT